jgi:hypothetical protein
VDVVVVVTAADLRPWGWACEGCGRPFAPGDVAHGQVVEHAAQRRHRPRLTKGWRCKACFAAR